MILHRVLIPDCPNTTQSLTTTQFPESTQSPDLILHISISLILHRVFSSLTCRLAHHQLQSLTGVMMMQQKSTRPSLNCRYPMIARLFVDITVNTVVKVVGCSCGVRLSKVEQLTLASARRKRWTGVWKAQKRRIRLRSVP